MADSLGPDWEKVAGRTTGGIPSDLDTPFFVPLPGRAYHDGTAVPVLGVGTYRLGESGLAAPSGSGRKPFDFIGTYVTLGEYLPECDPSSLLVNLVAQHGQMPLVVKLAELGRAAVKVKDWRAQAEDFATSTLRDPYRQRLLDFFSESDGGARVLLTRQTILHAMKLILSMDEPQRIEPVLDADSAAVLSAHAAASLMKAASRDVYETGTMVGMSEMLFMELVRNSVFNSTDDAAGLIDRHFRLWTVYNPTKPKHISTPPAKLFESLMGVALEDFWALGWGLYASVLAWKTGDPPGMRRDFGLSLDPAVVESFWALVGVEQAELRDQCRSASGDWDMLAFERTPAMAFEDGFVVLDPEMLLARITTGLYWDVHDKLKATMGEAARQEWTQYYGEMIELLVEDSLATTAPPILGGGSSFFTEEDLAAAYPGSKACDVAIDLGQDWCLFEIVKGEVTTGTRIEGSPEAFARDIQKVVAKKARQLVSAADEILRDETPLTGAAQVLRRRVLPNIVTSGHFPWGPHTVSYLSEEADLPVPEDLRVAEIVVLDLGEVEMLEALAEKGVAPHDALMAWRTDALAGMPFRNFALAAFKDRFDGPMRPRRISDSIGGILRSIASRLGLRVDASGA